MGRLQGKTMLITAAANGMGLSSAMACAHEGARVFATDIDQAGLAKLKELAKTNGFANRIETHLLDVRKRQEIEALHAQLPPLDVLFNCAGIVPNGTVLDVKEEDWHLAFDVNVHSMFHMTRAFLPAMLERARESSVSIINMASVASSVKGFTNRCAYGASKAAVIGLTKSIAMDYVKQGVRCNALCPGTVDTPSLRQRIAAAADPVQAEKDFIARQPMGKLAKADEIVPLLVYLASDESTFITGQVINVDGGITI